VREVAQLGGSVKGLVPELVEQNLRGKLDPAYQLGEFRDVREKKKPKTRKRA
jgi:hypothetical protein